MGVVNRRWVWVESMGVVWVESMGVASGCDCKEVYRFPHPIPLVSALFLHHFQHSGIDTFI